MFECFSIGKFGYGPIPINPIAMAQNATIPTNCLGCWPMGGS